MDSKIQLSDLEFGLLNNAEWILTKNQIVRKAQLLLGEASETFAGYGKEHTNSFPKEVLTAPPKISKGENYLGLPWLMLDYPRQFNKENIYAVRTMFWWGHSFSITLHLAGTYKHTYASKLFNHFPAIAANDFHLCVHEDQWHHHFEKENYLPVRNINEQEFRQRINDGQFIKLAKPISFNQWDNMVELLIENFRLIIGWLN